MNVLQSHWREEGSQGGARCPRHSGTSVQFIDLSVRQGGEVCRCECRVHRFDQGVAYGGVGKYSCREQSPCGICLRIDAAVDRYAERRDWNETDISASGLAVG